MSVLKNSISALPAKLQSCNSIPIASYYYTEACNQNQAGSLKTDIWVCESKKFRDCKYRLWKWRIRDLRVVSPFKLRSSTRCIYIFIYRWIYIFFSLRLQWESAGTTHKLQVEQCTFIAPPPSGTECTTTTTNCRLSPHRQLTLCFLWLLLRCDINRKTTFSFLYIKPGNWPTIKNTSGFILPAKSSLVVSSGRPSIETIYTWTLVCMAGRAQTKWRIDKRRRDVAITWDKATAWVL